MVDFSALQYYLLQVELYFENFYQNLKEVICRGTFNIFEWADLRG